MLQVENDCRQIMNPLRLLIRADATVAMGMGHVMRCLALAQACQDAGGSAVFAMAQATPAAEERICAERMAVVRLDAVPGTSEDASLLADAARCEQAEWVVVDGYQFGSEYQRRLKQAGLKVLFLDDYGHAESYCADLVLNQGLDSEEGLYANRELGTRLLLGSRYAMLRREFVSWRDWEREIVPTAKKVLVTIGGSDPDNVTALILQALGLATVDDFEVTVVVGGSNPHIKAVQRSSSWFPGTLRILQSVGNMADLMAWADLAVSAAGTTSWEMFFLGLPAILIPVAENQRPASRRFREIGAARAIEPGGPAFVEELANAVSELLQSNSERARLSSVARKLVDGYGTVRILQAMGCPVAYQLTSTVSTVPVESRDRKEFLNMAERHFRELSPEFTRQEDWVQTYLANILANRDASLCWIMIAGERAGFILFGIENHRFLPRKTGMIYEVYVAPAYRRKRIAATCARWAIRELGALFPSKIQLEVTVGNTGAAKLWESLGFRKVTDRYVLDESK